MKIADIKSVLNQAVAHYPDSLQAAQHSDIERIAFHIKLVVDEKGTEGSLCDIGGGIGLFPIGCAALGMKVTLIDDFGDKINKEFGSGIFDVHDMYRIRVIAKNVIEDDLDFPKMYFDSITSFDSMEHWHHSPKGLFHRILSWLKPGGLFVLGVPNCVNLRKRVSVPFGVGKWSQMEEWYESDVFRGHVREPDVDDLEYIAMDMNLTKHRIVGRNWLGYNSRVGIVKRLVPYVDHVLRLRPSLCSDIYLVGKSELSTIGEIEDRSFT